MISFARESPKSNTLLIILRSSLSMTPSSCPTSTMVRSSSSVITSCLALGSTCIRVRTPNDILLTTKITGVNALMKVYIIFAFFKEIFSAEIVDKVFGVISPNTRISKVRIPVAIPTALLPNNSIVNVVISDEAERLTRLFPMRIALFLDHFSQDNGPLISGLCKGTHTDLIHRSKCSLRRWEKCR